MGSKCTPRLKRFELMPNFRVVGGIDELTNDEKPAPCVYRSSRPDFLREGDLLEFERLGIRTILDFRSVREYKKFNGKNLVDHVYPLYKIKVPIWSVYKPNQGVEFMPLTLDPPKEEIAESVKNEAPENTRHFILDFFKANYIWAVFNRAPLWFRIFSLIYAIFDLILQTEFRYFVRAFAKKVLNKEGLIGQYKDMINHSQGSIVSALKILSEPQNVPAMINCAHGKDRTGIVSAMILSCLGRTNQEIAEDYAQSAVELEPIKERVRHEIVDKFDMCPTFATAKFETMMELLEYIDKTWGSVSNYLEAIGFSRQDQERLASNLTSYSKE